MSTIARARFIHDEIDLLACAGPAPPDSVILLVQQQIQRSHMFHERDHQEGAIDTHRFLWHRETDQDIIMLVQCNVSEGLQAWARRYKPWLRDCARRRLHPGIALHELEHMQVSLRSVQGKVDALHALATDMVEVSLQNTAQLSDLEVASLHDASAAFQQRSAELRRALFWRGVQTKMAIAGAIVLVLGVIVAIGYASMSGRPTM